MRKVCFLYQLCSTGYCLDAIYSQDFQQSSHFQRNTFVMFVLLIKPESCLCVSIGYVSINLWHRHLSSALLLSHRVLLASLWAQLHSPG